MREFWGLNYKNLFFTILLFKRNGGFKHRRPFKKPRFYLKKSGWALSPLYDVNPVPYGDELSLNINENDNRISIPLAIETAHRFCIKEEDAVKMAKEITETVKNNWEKLAVKYGSIEL